MCGGAKHCSNTKEALSILLGMVPEEQGDWKKAVFINKAVVWLPVP